MRLVQKRLIDSLMFCFFSPSRPQFHGQGKLVYSNTTYVGQFMNGKKNGQGVMSWNGTLQKYEGPWVDNK